MDQDDRKYEPNTNEETAQKEQDDDYDQQRERQQEFIAKIFYKLINVKQEQEQEGEGENGPKSVKQSSQTIIDSNLQVRRIYAFNYPQFSGPFFLSLSHSLSFNYDTLNQY